MILSLAGEYPESALATGGNYLHSKIADVTTTHLEFPSGLRAHIFVSWLHPFKVQQLVVVGDRKMAVFDDTKPWVDRLLLYPHEIRWQNNVPVPAKAEPERVEIPQAEPLRVESEHFLQCISKGCNPVTDGREGLKVLRILNACQQSLNRHGAKVYPTESAKKQSHNGSNGAPRRGNDLSSISGYPEATFSRAFSAHETAIIDSNVSIGSGVKIWHFSHILSGTRIGNMSNIGQNVVIGPDVTIGNGCKVQNNVSVYKGVTLEDDVFCGPSMVFTNVYNPRAHIKRMHELRPTLIKKGATLGANSTIVCGVTIGRYAFVGAGAVVTKDIPDHALVVGNPGHQIGWICACGERLPDSLECPECGKIYDQCVSGIGETLKIRIQTERIPRPIAREVVTN